MKQEHTYKVYIVDTDGSERLAMTVTAKSEGHAKSIAQSRGFRKISSVERQVSVD